jgi:hypothetical protein
MGRGGDGEDSRLPAAAAAAAAACRTRFGGGGCAGAEGAAGAGRAAEGLAGRPRGGAACRGGADVTAAGVVGSWTGRLREEEDEEEEDDWAAAAVVGAPSPSSPPSPPQPAARKAEMRASSAEAAGARTGLDEGALRTRFGGGLGARAAAVGSLLAQKKGDVRRTRGGWEAAPRTTKAKRKGALLWALETGRYLRWTANERRRG